jgi:hypothetical protein
MHKTGNVPLRVLSYRWQETTVVNIKWQLVDRMMGSFESLYDSQKVELFQNTKGLSSQIRTYLQ